MTSAAVRDRAVLLAIGAGVVAGAGVALVWWRRGRRSEPIVVEVPEGSTLQVPRCMLPQLCDMVLHVFYGCPEYIWRPGKENEPLFLLSAGKDVTKEFKDLLRGGSVSANNANFGDPAPDREKVLVIRALPTFHGSFIVMRDGGQSQTQIPGDDELGLPDGFNEAPLRPQHQVLRSMADPRLDPSLFVRYDPRPERKTGAVIIVVPGGNYDESDINCEEGQPVALWLASLGITAVVLQYRCISEGHFWPAQFEDWKACAQTVAAQAAAWGCDPSRIGVIGFSAGGHLAGYAALKAEQCPRPKLQVLVYPAVDTLTPRLSDYMMPWRADQGYPPVEDSLHKLAHAEAPPAFLAGSRTTNAAQHLRTPTSMQRRSADWECRANTSVAKIPVLSTVAASRSGGRCRARSGCKDMVGHRQPSRVGLVDGLLRFRISVPRPRVAQRVSQWKPNL